jgi:hypothetical protein
MVMNSKSPGLAYAVFKCSDPRPKPEVLARFKQALENVKLAHEETKIPPETEFQVFHINEGKPQVLVNGESAALVERIVEVEQKGANFMIFSSLPNAPNGIAARDLGDTLNMLYGGTELFDAESGRVVMDVFFREESGSYTSIIDLAISDGYPAGK